MLNRIKPDLEASLVLTELETRILDRLIHDPTTHSFSAGTLSQYLIKIARLGGYLAHAKDPPPGNNVMWRGLGRLSDIALGATLLINDVGTIQSYNRVIDLFCEQVSGTLSAKSP